MPSGLGIVPKNPEWDFLFTFRTVVQLSVGRFALPGYFLNLSFHFGMTKRIQANQPVRSHE